MPMSILINISKIYEKLIYNQLYDYFDDIQWGVPLMPSLPHYGKPWILINDMVDKHYDWISVNWVHENICLLVAIVYYHVRKLFWYLS